MKKIINLTPHDIRVMDRIGDVITFPKSGQIARVTTSQEKAGSLNGIQLSVQKMGKVENLPEFQVGTFLIVSAMVLAATDRQDCIAPDTGASAVRNAAGQIEAVKGFIKNNLA